MVQQPLVSVIVPFLNPGRFLDEAIQSVFAQSYTRWELLLVDDGSHDGSSDIAHHYAEQYPDKVRALEHPGHINLGLSASRNLGIRNARGDLIAFLDADDVWLPHKLDHQTGILERYPEVGLVCGPSLYWHSWGQETYDADRVVPIGAPHDVVSDPPNLLLEVYPLGRGAAPCPTSILVRRGTCERVGGFEETFRGIFSLYEDQPFLAKIYLISPVFVSSLCCDYYRQHASSITSETLGAGKYNVVRLNYLNWLENFLTEMSCDNDEVWDALQRALYRYRRPVAWFLTEMRSEPRKQLKAVGGYMIRRSLPRAAYLWLRRRLTRSDQPTTQARPDRQEAQANPPPAATGGNPSQRGPDAGRPP